MSPPLSFAIKPHLNFEIFENDFEIALLQARATHDLLFCTIEAHPSHLYHLNCFDAVKNAIKSQLKYKSIILKLVLKIINQQEPDIMISKEIDTAIQEIDPLLPIEQTTEQIIQSALAIGKKYHQ